MGTPTAQRVDAPGVRTWRWVAAVLAVSQLVAPAVANVLAGNFLETGATNEALITPAGYAFGLWGVITVLCAITAVAVVRYGLGAWWEKSLLVSACVVFVGFCMWLLVAAQDWLWVSVVVFVVMVSALIHIVRLLVLRRHDLSCPLVASRSGDSHLRAVSGVEQRRGLRECRGGAGIQRRVGVGGVVAGGRPGAGRDFRAHRDEVPARDAGPCGRCVVGPGRDRDRRRTTRQRGRVGDRGGGRRARGGCGGVGVLGTTTRWLNGVERVRRNRIAHGGKQFGSPHAVGRQLLGLTALQRVVEEHHDAAGDFETCHYVVDFDGGDLSAGAAGLTCFEGCLPLGADELAVNGPIPELTPARPPPT